MLFLGKISDGLTPQGMHFVATQATPYPPKERHWLAFQGVESADARVSRLWVRTPC
jgi:hypothetical protein